MEDLPLKGEGQSIVLQDLGVPEDVVDLVNPLDGLSVSHGRNLLD